MTVLNFTDSGYLSVYSADLSNTNAMSNLNYLASSTVTNAVVTKVSSSGRIKITATNSAVDVIVDTQGWYATPTGQAGGELTVVNPTRIVDTRAASRTGACPSTSSQCLTVQAGGTRTVQVTGECRMICVRAHF